MEEIGARGYPKEAIRSENLKIRGPFNSMTIFRMILEENGSQDGGQNRPKIDKNVNQNLIIFSLSFEHHFGAMLG